MTVAENSAGKQRGRPFEKGRSGNPTGKPKGTRHRVTEMVEALLAGEAEGVARAVIAKAIDGDMTAARLVLERIAPPRKGRAVALALPAINGVADLVGAQQAVAAAMADGEISPDEAMDASKVLEGVGMAMERRELEARIAALEGKGAKA